MTDKIEYIVRLIMAGKVHHMGLESLADQLLMDSSENIDGWSTADVLLALRKKREDWHRHAEEAATRREAARWSGCCNQLCVLITSVDQKRRLQACELPR